MTVNLKNSVSPLTWSVPIVNKDGTPTNEFMRKWQAQAGVNSAIPADITTLEQVSALLDLISGTPDDILVRGASLWGGVDPATLFDALGAAAAAQAAAEAFAADASNLSSGTVPVARLPTATTSAEGVVKPDGTTIAVAGGVISVVGGGGGGSGNVWAVPCLSSGNFSGADTSGHATKGNCVILAAPITVDKATFISDGGASGHALICSIWSLNTSTDALIAQVGTTATATGPGATGTVTFTFSPAVSLSAGTAYVILITDTGAASGTASLDMYAGGGQTVPTYPNVPTALNDHNTNGAGFVLSTNVLPTAGASLGAASAPLAIMFRFQS